MPSAPLTPEQEARAQQLAADLHHALGDELLALARSLVANERRPFGVGPFAQPVALPGGRPALYEPATSTSARRLALHTPGGELLVSTKKLSPDTLDRVSRFAERKGIAVRFFRVELMDTAADLADPSNGWAAQRTV